MQSVFVIITKLIASKNDLCKEVVCNNVGRDGKNTNCKEDFCNNFGRASNSQNVIQIMEASMPTKFSTRDQRLLPCRLAATHKASASTCSAQR